MNNESAIIWLIINILPCKYNYMLHHHTTEACIIQIWLHVKLKPALQLKGQLWPNCFQWTSSSSHVKVSYRECLWVQNIIYILHQSDVIMSMMASQITSLMIVNSTVYSGADQRKHQSSTSLAFVWRIHQWPVNSPHKGPVTQKMFPFDDVIMTFAWLVFSAVPCNNYTIL